MRVLYLGDGPDRWGLALAGAGVRRCATPAEARAAVRDVTRGRVSKAAAGGRPEEGALAGGRHGEDAAAGGRPPAPALQSVAALLVSREVAEAAADALAALARRPDAPVVLVVPDEEVPP